ncbi:hypothetical protein [Micromonospora taraxaci]|uniref:hypothetical protein n=1 Tax=Micromonospora taraxaci TaxID=1316803 RepID=UPI0011A2E313|nr:hypothetical protein [Micromonospora taraxaci]
MTTPVTCRCSRPLDLTICRLDGCDHLPSFDEREDIASISSQYSTTLVTWLESQLSIGAADRRGCRDEKS